MTRGLSILERLIKPPNGGFSAEHARYLLSLDFSDEQQARYADLAARVQEGALTDLEMAELDEFVTTGTFLAILQSMSRVALKESDLAK